MAMASFDFCQSAVVRIALSRVISEIFDAEEYYDLEIPVMVAHRANLYTICFSLALIVWVHVYTASCRPTEYTAVCVTGVTVSPTVV